MSENNAVLAVAIAVIVCVACGFIGYFVADRKNMGPVGAILGVLLGPVGVLIAAVALDARQQCPKCRERINEGATICPHCKAELKINRTAAASRRTETCPTCGRLLFEGAPLCNRCNTEVFWLGNQAMTRAELEQIAILRK
ncbi:MAG: zinc ribbon domain-containing protein [Opitutaceae bacterium]